MIDDEDNPNHSSKLQLDTKGGVDYLKPLRRPELQTLNGTYSYFDFLSVKRPSAIFS